MRMMLFKPIFMTHEIFDVSDVGEDCEMREDSEDQGE
jgi:hypothetical protein